ncbi:hypothetical protein C8Q80DRAFT_1274599 [Daedaleopsis nitida]|nr:hypothetical protein C8Q80DRAFT_1274599 [Daedaleopsis nitida]
MAFRNARLPLHPDVHKYARLLLMKGVSGPSVYTQTNMWSQITFPPIKIAWDRYHRYTYLPYDTTSLYRSLRLLMGISQRSLPHENLDSWFCDGNPVPFTPELTAACLFYQPYILGQTDRFILILSTPEQQECA